MPSQTFTIQISQVIYHKHLDIVLYINGLVDKYVL
jgi:hypothetical protein